MSIFGTLVGFSLFTSAIAAPVTAEIPFAPPAPAYEVAMTAYNAVPGQTDSTPFETASGAYSNPEVVAARSQDLKEELPFGTIIEIDAPLGKQNSCGYNVVSPILGYRVIADTMNAKFTKRVDVLFDTNANFTLADGTTKNASTIFGICKSITVRVVGRLDPKRMGNLPKTQEALAAIVLGQGDNTIAFK